MIDWPFNSHKWSTKNFSLQYPYIIQQIGDENVQTNTSTVNSDNFLNEKTSNLGSICKEC